ncbi:hypothetical protein [Campylobacter sp.]|uniref:hypothetical protein n=1 Tax=Campylobacter sp. TaxID=205 RepID=UPI002A82A99F|nr:hypothetical protein [Campylobacter sp.]
MGWLQSPKLHWGGGYSYINANSVLENTIIGRYSCVAHNVTIGALRHESTSVAMASPL